MHGKYSFREPLLTNEEGLYITAAQMQFFLNRSSGEKHFKEGHPSFVQYYHNCCLYNLVYDMMEEDSKCAKMYWDSENKCVAVSFSTSGEVAQTLSEISFDREDDEDSEDEFGLFK